ncbi:MAG: glycosyltransferase family 2 protein [Desulfobulbaceae bacterium]|nr:MAG: glycosyltransferase family 2 protein [Desulfobulbaceae bacterium]
MIDITVAIPTRNEEKNIRQCLENLSGFREVILIDSGSTDATVRIADEFQVKILKFKWDGKFPKKRNWLLRTYKFTTEWVLFLDADEVLTPEFKKAVVPAVEAQDTVGYWLNYADHFQGKLLRFGLPMKKLALFKVGAGEFERIDEQEWSSLDMEVHEHPVLSGKTGEIKEPLVHYDCKGLYQYIGRHNDYSSWEARRYFEVENRKAGYLTTRQRIKYRLLNTLWFAPGYFLFVYILRFGFLDGREGFHFAVHKAYYFFSILCKIREIERSHKLCFRSENPEDR